MGIVLGFLSSDGSVPDAVLGLARWPPFAIVRCDDIICPDAVAQASQFTQVLAQLERPFKWLGKLL